MMLRNCAPQHDKVVVEDTDYRVTIERDAAGRVWIHLEDKVEGGTATCVLGTPGTTEKP